MQYTSDKKWFARLPIAHRGLYNDHGAPENTLAACEAAIKKGYAIELDVRVCADNQIVVFHDATLDRMTDHDGRVDRLESSAFQDITVGSSEEHIPLLQEVLDLVDNRVPLFFDLKSTFFDAKRDVMYLAQALEGYDGAYSVMSFDPRVVAWWTGMRSLTTLIDGQKKIYTQLGNGIAGQLFHGRFRWKAYASIITWKFCGSPGHFLAVPFQVVHLRFFQKRRRMTAHRTALPLLAWTIKDEEQKDRARKYADASIFSGGLELDISVKS